MSLHTAPIRPIEAIFLDAAGTLIRVRHPVGETYARVAAKHGLSLDSRLLETSFRSAWKSFPQPQHQGLPPPDDDKGWWRELVRRCFSAVHPQPLQPETFDPLFEDLYSHFAHPESWETYPDAVPAIQHLSRHHRLFVLSNFDRRLRPVLDGLGLASFFEGMIISSEIGASKPHSLIFSAAAKLAGCPPDRCLHIGDDPECDWKGAHLAGFQAEIVDRKRQDLHQIALEICSDSRGL